MWARIMWLTVGWALAKHIDKKAVGKAIEKVGNKIAGQKEDN